MSIYELAIPFVTVLWLIKTYDEAKEKDGEQT